MVISCNLNEAILSYGGMGVRRGDFILYYQQLKLKITQYSSTLPVILFG